MVDGAQKWMVTVSIMLATIMQALDTTIANVALPHMQGSLNATQEQVTWVLTSYIVAAAIMTAPVGILAARIGRKKLFLVSVVGFTVASALCGMAMNLPQMVLFRLLQGVFGAALVPLSQSVLLDINPKEKHGQAMAVWGMGIMLGPILGPTLGGWLTEYYNWRWVFYINVPIGIAAFSGIWASMAETDKMRERKFDLFGFVLLGVGVGALQLMLDRGQTLDWFSSTEIIAEGLLSAMAFYLFLVHVLTAKNQPFLEPAMFKDRNYALSLVFIFIIGIVLLASMALLPPFLQNLMGYPVMLTGLVLAPRGVGVMLAMMLVGRLIGKVDTRGLILFGLSTTAYSLHLMSLFNIEVPVHTLVYTGFVQGVGMGFVFVPLSTLAYATLAPHYRNDATAIFSLVRNLGSSVGISIVVLLLARNTQINHADLVSHLHSFGAIGAQLTGLKETIAGLGIPEASALAMLDGEVNKQAAAISYVNDFLAMMYVVLCSTPLVLMLKGPDRNQSSDAIADEVATAIE